MQQVENWKQMYITLFGRMLTDYHSVVGQTQMMQHSNPSILLTLVKKDMNIKFTSLIKQVLLEALVCKDKIAVIEVLFIRNQMEVS